MPNESTKRWNGLGVVLLAVAGLLSVYVLSVGPFWRIQYHKGLVGGARYQTIYAPIDWTCKRSGTAAALMNGYYSLWIPSDGLTPFYSNGELEFRYDPDIIID